MTWLATDFWLEAPDATFSADSYGRNLPCDRRLGQRDESGSNLLQLARSAFPALSTLWWSFKRVPIRVWHQLLNCSAATCDSGEHDALDATIFDHEAASSHYVDCSDCHVRTLKTTALVDSESCDVLDLYCSAHWPLDTQVGRRVALRNTEEMEILVGDKGYDDQSRDALPSEGVRPLI